MAKKFIGHVMPGVIRPIHILWNQVIGFFFIVLAILPISYILKDWSKPGSGPRLVMEILFTVVMAGFAIHSFLKARKISKS
ncbi:MAG: hypothetical protein WBE37_07155 [Bryobacteraceae bacterium]